MKQLIYLILLPVTFQCFSQNTWVENRMPYSPEESESDNALTYLYYGIHYDYKYDGDGQFVCDITYHAISKPNNDDGLASVNRIYIPLRNVIEVLDIKSRTISKDGKVIELDQNNIKEVQDEENEGGYRIFAVEGAEIGGEIEYLYTKRVYGSTFVSENIQFEFPIRKAAFTLSSPENLEFEFKIANDTNQIIQVDTSDTFNQYQAVLEDIPAFVSESFSGFDANKKRIDFRLSYNSVNGKKKINTYADAGKRIYDNAHNLTKDELKVIGDFIKGNDLSSDKSIQRLKHLEHELKKDLYMEENAPDDVVFLFENGFAGREAFLKVFTYIVELLQMDYEIVVTSNRFETKFDTEIRSWNYLDDYLFYFPEYKKFLPIHNYTDRYGDVPAENSATKGLFIHPEMITDFIYPISRIDYIPEASYGENMNNLDITVSFDQDITKSIVEAKRTYIGNEANYYKTTDFWMDQEQSQDMLKELAEYLATDGEVLNVEVLETNNEIDTWDKPYIVQCNFENKNFIEYAGNSILFKAGQLIGLQSELYKEEEERKYEVENFNNRGYIRNITIEIPKGYKIQNPDDIILDEKVYNGDSPVYVFESSYELSGNKLDIKIVEFYNEIFFPKERFEEFRTVINAAADWNKVTLILKEI